MSARNTATTRWRLAAAGMAALLVAAGAFGGMTAAYAAGSDDPTPYTVAHSGLTLPAGQTFVNGGHVNVRTNQGHRGMHFEALNNQPSGKWIGQNFLPWEAFGFDTDTLCVEWVQVGEFNEHFGEGGQEPVGRGCERGGVEEPGVEEPGVEEPGVEEPGVEEPGAVDPGAKQPGMTERPGAGDPEVEIVEPEPVEPEVVEPEVVEPEVVEPEFVVPEIVEPEVVEPEAVAPEVVEPEVVVPEVVVPENVVPEVVVPEVVEPEVVVPEVVEPETVVPEVVVPEVVVPEVVVPENVVPEVVAPEIVVPEVVEPEIVVPEIADPTTDGAPASIVPTQGQRLATTGADGYPLMLLAAAALTATVAGTATLVMRPRRNA